MAGGSYVLLCRRGTGGTVTVGARGEVPLPAGWYAYAGSARGPGGFARVDRHERTARGETDTRHWHVDHVLGDGPTTLDAVRLYPDRDVECEAAAALAGAGDPVARLGASDCDCEAHLYHAPDREPLASAAASLGGEWRA